MHSKRIALGLTLSFALASLGTCAVRAQSPQPLRFAISFPAARSAQPLDGRVLLFISADGRTEPRTQSDQYRANSTQPIFGVDVDGLQPGQPVIVDRGIAGWPARSLTDIPAGDYWVQALLNRYETFHRADGHTVKMPMDEGEGQHWESKPGNFYSRPVKLHVDPGTGGEIRISMDQEIPPITPPTDTAQVKYLDMASDGWRETPPDPNAPDAQRQQQAAAYRFYQDWNGPSFPRMIHVLVQHPTPYFDDSYAVNSANNGPYGDAITKDLIPYIERRFRGIGQGWARVVTGGSTGGWEALGVQVLSPDQAHRQAGLPRLSRSPLLDLRGSQSRGTGARHARPIGRAAGRVGVGVRPGGRGRLLQTAL